MLKTEYLCPPKIDMLKPNALSNGISSGAFERCLGQEGGALKNGMCFYKRDPRELACSIYHVRLQQKDSYLWASRPSPGTESAGTISWEFPVSRTGRSKCYLLASVYGIFVMATWMDEDRKFQVNPNIKWFTKNVKKKKKALKTVHSVFQSRSLVTLVRGIITDWMNSNWIEES